MKHLIKSLISLIFYLYVAVPLFLIYKFMLFGSYRCFTGISEFLSLFPGHIGYFARQAFYRLSINSGKDADIGFGTILQYPNIRIRNNVYIGQQCNIGKCTINSGVRIGSNVHIINKDTHDINERFEIMPTQVKRLKRVNIGKNSWIGNSSMILADIGNNCIIGAGSVVTKPVLDNSIVAGNPAKDIR